MARYDFAHCVLIFLTLVMLGISIAVLVVSLQTRSTLQQTNRVEGLSTSDNDMLARDTFERFSILATDIAGADHTPLASGERDRGYGAHLGPLRSARAMAIAHLAMTDAVALSTRAFVPYLTELDFVEPSEPVSVSAAIAAAAHDTLLWLYPAYARRVRRETRAFLVSLANTRAKQRGVELGQATAAAMIRLRAGDGADHVEPAVEAFESNEAGKWRRDPVAQHAVALGALWAERVAPFAIESARQFRAAPPPALDSKEYAMEFYEVTSLGGDGVISETVRDSWRTFVGNFWGYDGTPSLCAPPRLYLQITHEAARAVSLDVAETARLFSLVSLAMVDAGLASWDSKYHYSRERPVTAVRDSAARDGNELTAADAEWEPLGAPATNSDGPRFTPPFPAYPSGHATFGAAVCGVMKRFFGTDSFNVTFVSDEYNGKSIENTGEVRPFVPRTFTSFSEIAEENGQSRMYLGIHWASDKTSGVEMGEQVASYVFDRFNRALVT